MGRFSRRNPTALCVAALLGLTLWNATVVHGAATIHIVNLDGPGVGLNDPTQVAPVGGNPGTTLGQQRVNVFLKAAQIWGSLLDSCVPIYLETSVEALSCDMNSATIASAGPLASYRDFVGLPRPATFYSQALANSLTGFDVSPFIFGSHRNDLRVRVNGAIGTTCPLPLSLYLGLDGADPPQTIDLLTVVLHEMAHGLGFVSLVNLSTGERFTLPNGDGTFSSWDDIYMTFLENHDTGQLYPDMTDAERVTASTSGELHWTGASAIAANSCLTAGIDPSSHISMFAPDPARPGSSVSHFDTSLTPNALMEPFYTGPLHDPTYDAQLLTDLGWNSVLATCLITAIPAVSPPARWALFVGLLLLIALIALHRGAWQ